VRGRIDVIPAPPSVTVALLDALGPAFVAGVHGIGGGVWIGAVAFNLFVLTPRAQAWFADAGAHEDFVFNVVHGLRWPVLLGALAVVGAGGWRWHALAPSASEAWSMLMALKVVCTCASLAMFGWVTLRLWPSRAFATVDELPGVRRRFHALGIGIVGANTLAAALGVLAGQLVHR